jgi:hypothetical protein
MRENRQNACKYLKLSSSLTSATKIQRLLYKKVLRSRSHLPQNNRACEHFSNSIIFFSIFNRKNFLCLGCMYNALKLNAIFANFTHFPQLKK